GTIHWARTTYHKQRARSFPAASLRRHRTPSGECRPTDLHDVQRTARVCRLAHGSHGRTLPPTVDLVADVPVVRYVFYLGMGVGRTSVCSRIPGAASLPCTMAAWCAHRRGFGTARPALDFRRDFRHAGQAQLVQSRPYRGSLAVLHSGFHGFISCLCRPAERAIAGPWAVV